MEVPHFAHTVFYEASVLLAYVLWQVAEEDELWIGAAQLRDVFNLDALAFDGGRRVLLLHDGQQALVQLAGGDAATATFVHLLGSLQDFEDALFVEHRGEDDRNIVERCDAFADDVGVFFGRAGLFLYKIPLIYHDDRAFFVALYETEDVEVLLFDTLRGVEDEDADVRTLYGAHAAQHAVELQVFVHFLLFAQAGGVHKVEVETEHIVARVDAVSCGAGNGRHDVAVGAGDGVDETALAYVGSPYHSDARQAVGGVGFAFVEVGHQQVEQVASATAGHSGNRIGLAQA